MSIVMTTLPEGFNVNNLIEELFEKPSRYGNESAVELYARIIKRIDETKDDLGKDPEFIKNVRKFFGIGYRSSEFAAEFCSLIREVRNEYESFDVVAVSDRLTDFSESKYEISFASKIIHLADVEHDFIIYDTNVRACFGLENLRSTPQTYIRLRDSFIDFKNKLQSGNQDRVCVECRMFLDMFDEKLANNEINLSENKKIDFYLWKLGGYLKKSHKK